MDDSLEQLLNRRLPEIYTKKIYSQDNCLASSSMRHRTISPQILSPRVRARLGFVDGVWCRPDDICYYVYLFLLDQLTAKQ